MKQRWKRIIAAFLAAVMAFSLALSPLGERAIAADYDGVSADTHTMYYPWVQINAFSSPQYARYALNEKERYTKASFLYVFNTYSFS